jgi:hypothetical protein
VHDFGYGPAGSSGIILCNVAMNLFKLAKGALYRIFISSGDQEQP